MAGSRRIVIEFLGKDVSASRAANQVEGRMSKIGGAFGRFGRTAGLALSGGIALGATAVIKSAVDLEAQFGQTMNLVGASTKAPQSELKKLNDLAIKLGKDTSFSANEAADSMLELAKAGISTEDIMGGALAGTLTLAAAGGTDLATAATIASNAMNTFNLEGKDMAMVAAALAGGANASSASVDSLGQALQQVGPGAKNVGFSLQETVAALSAFDAAGIKGSDAGTSLKTMLTRLIPSTEKASSAMEAVGLFTAKTGSAFVNADGSFKSLAQISALLNKQLSGLSEAQRTQALSAIFGSDATRAATVLMNEGGKGIRKYIKATKDQDAAQRMADARMSGTKGSLERLSGALETVRLQLGQAVAPAIVAGANLLSTKLIPALSSLFESGDKVSRWFNTNLGPTIRRVTGGMNGDVSKNLGAIQSTFQSVTSIITSLWNRFGGFITTYLMGSLQNAMKAVSGALQIISGVFKVFASLLKGDWQGVWDGIKQILSGALTIIKALVSQALNIIKTAWHVGWSAIRALVGGIWDGIKALVRAGVDGIVDAVKAIPGRVRALGGVFKEAGRFLIQSMVDGLKNAAGVISGIAGNVWDAVRSLLNAGIDKINAALEFKISLPGPDIHVNPTNIPHLARGGVVRARRGGTLALLGEAGHDEAVVPLSGPNAPRGGLGGGVMTSAPIILQLDSRTVWKGLLKVKRDGGIELGLA